MMVSLLQATVEMPMTGLRVAGGLKQLQVTLSRETVLAAAVPSAHAHRSLAKLDWMETAPTPA